MSILRGLIRGVLLGGTLAGVAVAQDEGAPLAPVLLEETIVTAQRREENLQQVPIAATALDAAALEAHAVARLADLQTATPSLSITNAGQTQSVNIRGIGLASNSPNATAGVATYVDGLFQPPIVQSNGFYDLASIEVLRGPQGTLVGTSSTGGAIFVNSRNPEPGNTGGHIQVGLGNFDQTQAEGAINLAAGDSLALRLAGIHQSRESYFDDVGPFDNDAGKLEESGARVGVLWQPGALRVLAKVEWHDRRTGGYDYRPIEGTTYAGFREGDIRTLSFDADTSHREKAMQASLELRQEFDSGLVLRWLGGYQHKRIFSFDDIDGSQAPPEAAGQIIWDYYARERQDSHELNLISPTDGRFDWILGAYYQRNVIDVLILTREAGFPIDIYPANRRTTTGFFAQGNYQLNEAWELQAGARYSTYETAGAGGVFIGTGIPGFPPGGVQVADLSGHYRENKVTGKVALNWQVNDRNLAYLFVARGYKPGGFNSVTSSFKPETVLNYELGLKSTLAGGRVRTQLAAFYNDYSDFQFDVLEPLTGQGGIFNVADGTIQGIEAQIEARFGGFGFDATLAYVDSELDGLTFVNERLLPPGTLGSQCPPGVPASPPFCFDYAPFTVTSTGGSNLYSPEWTLNLGAEYAFRLGDDAELTPRINYAHVGSRFTYIAYSPVSDRIDSYGVVSALLTLRKGAWQVTAYGTNLSDEEYVSGQASASRNEFYGAPREYGLRVSLEF